MYNLQYLQIATAIQNNLHVNHPRLCSGVKSQLHQCASWFIPCVMCRIYPYKSHAGSYKTPGLENTLV